jgi:hypothetical protein
VASVDSSSARRGPWDGGGSYRDKKPLQARPWVFVGTAAQCGGPAGSHIVTSGWLAGMGLPDDGTTANAAPAAANDSHIGLLLNKNGPTPNCSASGATIEGLPKHGTTISELGFDYRIGGHCGAGAPRFNIITTTGFLYFAGCSRGAQTPAPQDPTEWTRVRFSATAGIVDPAASTNPPFVFGTTQVKSIEIVFDEGTDTVSPSDPTGVGLAVLDNIDISGKLITRGRGLVPTSGGCGHGWGSRKYCDD